MGLLSTIKRYFEGILTDEFHRYKSWEVCNDAFNNHLQIDAHTLHLAVQNSREFRLKSIRCIRRCSNNL